MGNSTIEDQVQQAIRQEVLPAVQAAISQQIVSVVDELKTVAPSKKTDARDRALRTFVQQLGIDTAIALLTVLATAIVGLDITSQEAWTGLGILLLKTALSAPVSYLARLKFMPSTSAGPTVSFMPLPVGVPVQTATAAPVSAAPLPVPTLDDSAGRQFNMRGE